MLFEGELKKLGLRDKEAAVYLSCLQLGPSPVQVISRKAKVVRATTYVVLESLMEQGLVTKYKEGKKTLFSAEPPRQLMRLLEKEQELVQEKRGKLENLLPELQVLMKAAGGRPVVRYFEGIEGLRSIRREMMMYSQVGDMWYNFTPVDHLDALLSSDEESYYRQRIAKGIKTKTIFSTKSPSLRKEMEEPFTSPMAERRFVSSKFFPSTSGVTIFRDRIAIGSFSGNVGGVIVESADMADMVRRLFELAWVGAEKVQRLDEQK